MRHNKTDREALSVTEAAAAAGLGRATLYQLLARGEGPQTFHIGRRHLVRVAALREWLAKLEAEGQGGDAQKPIE